MEPSYLRELDEIKNKCLLMAELAKTNAENALKSLVERDFTLAEEVILKDKEIDRIENEINAEAIRYMTLRQPVASDMRLITVSLKATHDIERIGDEAKAIAKRVKLVHQEGVAADLKHIPEMGEAVFEMLQEAVQSLTSENVDSSVSVIRRDKQVDSMNRSNFEEFSADIAQHPENCGSLLALILISKSLERMADHATNIAEEAIFLFSGKEVRHSGLKSKLGE